MKKKIFGIGLLTALFFAFTTVCSFAEEEGQNIGETLPIWSVLPFVGMLLSIAIFPLVAPEWWEKFQLWVALGWSAVFLIPFGIAYGGHELLFRISESVLVDYLPFIVLLFGLFVCSGGIVLKGSIRGTTKTNLILLLIGTALASWIGTTGAAMLLIRPIIRANEWREKKAHIIIFFIFMVANMGGCLTPVGDPPLFLGFLRGVPFFWTMKLVPILIFNVILISIIFVFMDRRYVKKELENGRSPINVTEEEAKEPIRIEGAVNFIFIVMIVGAVILNGILSDMSAFKDAEGVATGITVFGATLPYTYLIQIGIILLAAVLSLAFTKKETREANEFTYGPIAEVAKLFIGIFLTMIPALAILGAKGGELGLEHPWQFFWMTGALSSFLDNAPTYLVFLTTAGSLGYTGADAIATTVGNVAPVMLMAISAGAVFMGANTYIGNAPNFMVKSIAEEKKIKMPSFFGYMAWSLSILIPIFIIDTFLFFILIYK